MDSSSADRKRPREDTPPRADEQEKVPVPETTRQDPQSHGGGGGGSGGMGFSSSDGDPFAEAMETGMLEAFNTGFCDPDDFGSMLGMGMVMMMGGGGGGYSPPPPPPRPARPPPPPPAATTGTTAPVPSKGEEEEKAKCEKSGGKWCDVCHCPVMKGNWDAHANGKNHKKKLHNPGKPSGSSTTAKQREKDHKGSSQQQRGGKAPQQQRLKVFYQCGRSMVYPLERLLPGVVCSQRSVDCLPELVQKEEMSELPAAFVYQSVCDFPSNEVFNAVGEYTAKGGIFVYIGDIHDRHVKMVDPTIPWNGYHCFGAIGKLSEHCKNEFPALTDFPPEFYEKFAMFRNVPADECFFELTDPHKQYDGICGAAVRRMGPPVVVDSTGSSSSSGKSRRGAFVFVGSINVFKETTQFICEILRKLLQESSG